MAFYISIVVESLVLISIKLKDKHLDIGKIPKP
jgi:hypothetical protein